MKELNWQTLKERRMYQKAMFMFKVKKTAGNKKFGLHAYGF